jgi:hypothetical protein
MRFSLLRFATRTICIAALVLSLRSVTVKAEPHCQVGVIVDSNCGWGITCGCLQNQEIGNLTCTPIDNCWIPYCVEDFPYCGLLY